jgi:nitroreductase
MAKGLGTCWSGKFHEDKVKGIGIPENILAVVMLTRGYSAESAAARPMKELEQIAAYDEWPSSVRESENAELAEGR